MRRVTSLAATGALAFASAAAWADAFKPSRAQQIELGQRAAREVRQKERVLPSSDERVRLVRRVGDRLLSTMGDAADDWRFSFEVIENKQVNAFALPGGPIFFYTGLLDKLETEDQLAGVLAHEIHHVTREHWAKTYADAQKRGLVLGLILGATRANSSWRTVAGVIDFVKYTAYSRGAETESDDRGFQMMVSAGYNPQGMADVFRMFARSRRGGAGFEWASTHPADERRIARIENRIRGANVRFPEQRPIRYYDYSR